MAAHAKPHLSAAVQSIVRRNSPISSIADPRERLLAAGLQVMLNSDLSLLVSGITPEAVTEVAKRSRRNFYDHFASTDEFVIALFERFLLDETQLGAHVEPTQQVTEVLDDYGEFRTEVASWFSLELLESLEIFSVLVSIAGLQARSSVEISDIVARHNEMFERIYVPRYEATIAEWNIELHPDWSPLRLAIVCRSFIDGFVLRNRPSLGEFTPSDFHLMTEVLVGIFGLASASAGWSGALLTGALSKESFARAGNPATEAGAQSTASGVVDLRRLVQDVLLAELKYVPAEALTLEYLADRAGVSPAAVRREVGSARSLSLAILDGLVTLIEGTLLDDVEDAERRNASCYDAVVAHLQRVRRFASEHVLLLRYSAVAAGTDPVPDNPLERLIDVLGGVLAANPGPLLVGPSALSAHDAARLLTLPLLTPETMELQPAGESTERLAQHCVARDGD